MAKAEEARKQREMEKSAQRYNYGNERETLKTAIKTATLATDLANMTRRLAELDRLIAETYL